MRVIHVAPTPFGPSGTPPASRFQAVSTSGLLGGGERYPFELARALASRFSDSPGSRCELITFGARASERWEGSLRVRTLRSAAYLHGHPAHPLALALPAAVWDADIVHTHHLRSTPSRMAALTARMHDLLPRSTAHAVVTDHGLQGSDWLGRLAGFNLQLAGLNLRLAGFNLLPRLFDRFLAVSAYSAGELAAPSERTRIIYGGADPARFAPDPQCARRGVLFVGRITPHKGIDRLIDALPDGAALTIAGSEGHDPEWPERGYPALLRRLAADRDVTFLGPVADADLPALYRRAAVLVLPSVERTVYGREIRVSELLGLVLLEAMMSGTPVIASALGGIPEVVEEGATGFLVEPGNVPMLRERLEQLLGDPALAARMGRAARELAQERFTWDACARRCLAVYEELR
jgi:glycosyltransferase involved in cell wall biosynthesis